MAAMVNESVKAQWRDLVNDAASSCEYKLDEEIESYLVFALIRFTQRADLADSAIALEYMQSLSDSGHKQLSQLREVGDKCLLFSGLFPQIYRKKTVDIGYYVNMGRASYNQLGQMLHKGFSRLYMRLSEYFIFLTDILHAMREMNGIPVMNENEKYQFWLKFDSKYARQSLDSFYNVIPFRPRSS